MTFEDRLASRFKNLPVRKLSDEDVAVMQTGIERRIIKHKLTMEKSRRTLRLGPLTAVAAAIVMVLVILYSVGLTPQGVLARHEPFNIVVSPDAMTPTPLDTVQFRSTVKGYLERHSISDTAQSSSGTSSTNTPGKTGLPVINQISDVAIRWSEIDKGQYGYAIITYIGDKKPRIAELIALKGPAKKWTIATVNLFPALSAAAYGKYPIFPSDWGGNDIAQGSISYRFVGGLVIDKAVTRIRISPKNGPAVSVPVINGVYGYAKTWTSGNAAYNGPYTVEAVTGNGKVVFKQG